MVIFSSAKSAIFFVYLDDASLAEISVGVLKTLHKKGNFYLTRKATIHHKICFIIGLLSTYIEIHWDN